MAENEPIWHERQSTWASWQSAPDESATLLGGRYLVLDEIGAGASSIMYRGVDQRLGRRVAIKILRSQYAVDPGFTRRFEREAKAAASVSHPNVVHVHDVGHHGDLLYLVMEYIDGENLKERLIREGPLPPLEAMRIALQLLAGLSAIHHAGIIHRDIKSQNILIGVDGVARVADFGVVHLIAETGLTTAGTALGTPAYMAPEQAQGGPLVRATDLYAVGVVLHEMVTGRVPFDAPDSMAVIYAHIHAPPPPPSRQVPALKIPPVVDQLVLRAMAKRPQDRFVDAEDMQRALGVAMRQLTGVQPGRRPRRWSAYGTLAVLLLALLFAGGASAWLLNRDPARPEPTLEPTAQQVAAAPTEPSATDGTDQPVVFSVASTEEGPIVTPAPTPTVSPVAAETPRPTSTSEPTETPRPTDAPVPTETPLPAPASELVEPIAESDVMPAEGQGVQSVQRSFTARDWQGAYFQEAGNLQPWSALYAQGTGYGEGSLTFTLEGEPVTDTFLLTVEGMTSENWTALPIAILVNGQQVYAGASPFPTWNGVDGQQPWTFVTFELPTRVLQPGENTVTIVNAVAEGGFSLPPYVLLADATVSVDVVSGVD